MSDPTAFLSPKDLARAVGVSESSVKRWADDGRLEFVRTAGGHRRIRVADAVRFVREAGLHVLRPDLLSLSNAAPSGRHRAPTAELLVETLRGGDDEAARRMLVSAFLQGESTASLCDGPIRGALGELGHLWKEGPAGIALEHHAVDTCVHALMEIRGMISVPPRAPWAVGGAMEGDPYVMPSLMAAIVLAEAGFRTLNLGPNAPTKAVCAAIEARHPDLVWRSASLETSPAALRADVGSIASTAARPAEIVVGGRGVPRGAIKSAVPVHDFGSMTELAGFAKGLRRAARRR